MKSLKAVSLLLISASICMAQTKSTSDQAFEEKLVKLLEPLYQKHMCDYLPGTEVTVQDFKDGKPYGPAQKSVLKAVPHDHTGKLKLRPLREPLPAYADENDPANIFKPRPAELQIDGHTVNCLLRGRPLPQVNPTANSSQANLISPVMRQWVLASHPDIVLREESVYVRWANWYAHTSPATWWAVTSIQAKKRVGNTEYECAEMKHDFYFYNGYTLTTDYVSAESPTLWVEKEEVFFQVVKNQKKPKLSFTRTWKLLEVKLPATNSSLNRASPPKLIS